MGLSPATEHSSMRILNVTVDLDPVLGGGTAERTFQISRALARKGVGCSVLVLDLGLTPERLQALDGAKLVTLPCLSRRYYLPRLSPRQVWKIREAVRRADVVHLMGHWTPINALVYLFARRFHKPYVICPAGSLPIYGRSKRLKRLYNLLIGKRIVRNAARHVAITAGEIPHFKSYGIAPDSVVVIPNGVNREDYLAQDDRHFRERFGLNGDPFVLFLGRLNEIKGPDLLLEAFCRAKDELPDHRLVFAGSDEGMLPVLRRMSQEYGVEDRVHFVGHLGGNIKSQAYHAAEILAIPSRQEAMSIVALEAGVTGTPVLLTDQCGFDEVAQIGGGRVVPASIEGLQTTLIDMLKSDELVGKMGANLQRFVEEHFTWDSIIKRYIVLYEDLLWDRSNKLLFR